ncbi:Hypothetical predicted protein [Octopus vulgaris]|uniref:Uncharacterized protein n=1 Tax=Octopus vulgaris TaxID=6645 RepID=A0AA36FK27_OCTVU|nr:Hypothetical predicted protein [Octopus vulgaris]
MFHASFINQTPCLFLNDELDLIQNSSRISLVHWLAKITLGGSGGDSGGGDCGGGGREERREEKKKKRNEE